MTKRTFATVSNDEVIGFTLESQWAILAIRPELDELIQGLKFLNKDEFLIAILVDFKEACEAHNIRTNKDLYDWKMQNDKR